ncbi:MAG: polynucleotide adenylyltransferase PcnB [Kiritimatiellia bacterium]|jgi:poly(A) polymerase
MLFHKEYPIIRKRADHCISRANIDPDALRVLRRLSKAGYTAYLVGGGVRDLLLGRKPKDFDVGTDARPNEIKRLFRNCFLVGRRFRLAHIRWGQNVIETSTFRKSPPPPDDPIDTLYQYEDNTFGSPEEDAHRRDFTVNGLFYDIKTFAVIDYVGGLRDLERKVLRSIGDPNIRFLEDPVRMMRAVRLAAVLDFTIDRTSRRAIRRHYREIEKASAPRLLEETFRLFSRHASEQAFQLLHETKLMSVLLPDVDAFVKESGGKASPLWKTLAAFDADPASDGDPSNALRLAVLYWPIFKARVEGLSASPDPDSPQRRGGRINHRAIAREILDPAGTKFRMPKMAVLGATYILDCQRRFDAPKTLRPGSFRGDFFDDALALFRIRLAADGQDTTPADRIGRRLAQSRSTRQPLYSEGEANAEAADEARTPRQMAENEDSEAVRDGDASDSERNSERPFGKGGRRNRRPKHRSRGKRRRTLPNPEVSGSPFEPVDKRSKNRD